MKISIIIPALNEEKSIGRIIKKIKENMKGYDYEIIVSDSSTDKTPEIAKENGARVVYPDKKGKGYAMKYAAAKARGKIIIFMDADGVNDPAYLKEMIKEMKEYDVVMVGPNPRTIRKDVKFHDRVIFRIYYFLSTTLFLIAGMRFNIDPLTGYRAIRKSLWEELKLESDDFRIESEMNLKIRDRKLKIKEIVCDFVQRVGGIGKSKLATNPVQILKIGFYILKHAKI